MKEKVYINRTFTRFQSGNKLSRSTERISSGVTWRHWILWCGCRVGQMQIWTRKWNLPTTYEKHCSMWRTISTKFLFSNEKSEFWLFQWDAITKQLIYIVWCVRITSSSFMNVYLWSHKTLREYLHYWRGWWRFFYCTMMKSIALIVFYNLGNITMYLLKFQSEINELLLAISMMVFIKRGCLTLFSFHMYSFHVKKYLMTCYYIWAILGGCLQSRRKVWA